MKRALLNALILAATACAYGCTTCDVTKVDPTTPPASAPVGVQYSLPKPFLQVTPAGDGSVSVNVIYLPDPNNTYAVNAKSYMAAHTLEVALDNTGVITKVNFAPDTSAVASQAATSAGNVGSSFETAAAQKTTSEQTKITTAEQAVQQAQATVEQDQAKLNEIIQLNAAGANPKIDENQPNIDLAAAQAALKSAQQALATLTLGGGGASGGGAPPPAPAPAPAPAQPPGPGQPQGNWVQVYGPVLYSIDATADGGVALTPVPISGVAQPQYYTTTSPSATRVTPAVSTAPTLSGPASISLSANPNPTFDITVSQAITAINVAKSGMVMDAPPPAPPTNENLPALTLLNGNKQIHVVMTAPAIGTYHLGINFSYLDGNGNTQSAVATVSFQIVP
jgi:hypothetical protein